MLPSNLALAISLAYVAFLFIVAFIGDRRARQGKQDWLHSPLTYTLSISVYCTSWTFYGAVGSAARNGLEFITIYLGPTFVFIGWWFLLRKLVHIGQLHHITSIADLISSRFGKSTSIAALVTVMAVIGTTPYIALQLDAVTTSFQVITGTSVANLAGDTTIEPDYKLAFWIAAGMALFTILFGTRSIDVNERHHGVVAAIAVEALVKLFALISVGLFVLLIIADGPRDVFAHAAQSYINNEDIFGARWIALTFLSTAAIVCLPRQFQVTVVENTDETHLRTASWLFPLYLFLMCLFVLPIAIMGTSVLPTGANPDMFVLTLPIWADQKALAMFAFLGGFSSATSMVIVACIALSTMLSNHIVMPIALRIPWINMDNSGDVKHVLLVARRVSICIILFLGFLYFRLSGEPAALAAIGLIAFAGVAQFLPAVIGGLYWRMANAKGALAGLSAGFVIWLFTLYLPSFGSDIFLSKEILEQGLFGLGFLKPYSLFGLEGIEPLIHSLFWSMSFNIGLFIGVSLFTSSSPLERLQSKLFIYAFQTTAEEESRVFRRSAPTNALYALAQRILGPAEANKLFADFAREQGLQGPMPRPDDAFVTHLERRLSGSVGASTARAMISQVVTGETISLNELMKIIDETQRALEYSKQVEEKSRELQETATELRKANDRLRQLDAEKDDFLSQVSHELRTPMTSIRSFTEILLETGDVAADKSQKFLSIIHSESTRLTRLLDQILDLSLLERSETDLKRGIVDAQSTLTSAIDICQGLATQSNVRLSHSPGTTSTMVDADADHLSQVFINIITNAIKYNTNPSPRVEITSQVRNGTFEVLIEDNGPGIAEEDRERVFRKFARGWKDTNPDWGGTGLGLAISRQIMRSLDGDIALLPSNSEGAKFLITIKVHEDREANLQQAGQ